MFSPIRNWLSRYLSRTAQSDRKTRVPQPCTNGALMGAICHYLSDNNLEPTLANLVTGHCAATGVSWETALHILSQPGKGQKLRRVSDGRTAKLFREESRALSELMERLEVDLDHFSASTKAAQTATSEYSGKLKDHVCELTNSQDTSLIISHITALAKAMMERTREMESDMRRSEQEASLLRKSLSDARLDAETDHLTGLPNRRAFELQLEKQHKEALAEGTKLCVAFCDIDNFKRINDKHGHHTGDRVIRTVGEYFSDISSDNCHVARHGGEEFVILFRRVDLEKASEQLNLARQRLAMRKFRNRENDEPIGNVTFSAGLADIFAYDSKSSALKAADQALYDAKESGRNAVHTAGQDMTKINS